MLVSSDRKRRGVPMKSGEKLKPQKANVGQQGVWGGWEKDGTKPTPSVFQAKQRWCTFRSSLQTNEKQKKKEYSEKVSLTACPEGGLLK